MTVVTTISVTSDERAGAEVLAPLDFPQIQPGFVRRKVMYQLADDLKSASLTVVDERICLAMPGMQ